MPRRSTHRASTTQPERPRYTNQYACGHTDSFVAWGDSAHLGGQTILHQEPCRACRVAALAAEREAKEQAASQANGGEVPAWFRQGYLSEAHQRECVAHDVEVRRLEQERADSLAQIAALPEAERPFQGAPMRGAPSLDELAREGGEED